jgi:deoxyribodipyrimidine photolyase-related protein
MESPSSVRRMLVLFGDQLDEGYLAHANLNREQDSVALIEVAQESTHVLSHVQRTVLFLSAMRHFASSLRAAGWRVHYVRLGAPSNTQSLDAEIVRIANELRPTELVFIHPGEWRVLDTVTDASKRAAIPCRVETDSDFLTSLQWFDDWASTRRQLRMEHFYRERRRGLGLLVDADGTPAGGKWNLDVENRRSFKEEPSAPPLPRFVPDGTTRAVMEVVRKALPQLPGALDGFNWPTTRGEALLALRDFVADRLALFGDYQDAMWAGQDTLYHSVLSSSLNLKLLRPAEVVEAAIHAFEEGFAPLNAVEGFVRQIVGWREYIRGVYWSSGRRYARNNALDADGLLPWFYWTGETDMSCMRDALRSVLERSYGHHIARLMITGNFALIAGITPSEVADWYLGMYVDGVEWATLPNVLGMALYADGGLMASKPYAASGNYINRMSNYCRPCLYDVRKRTGQGACPFNTLYWDFMMRHQERFQRNPRTALAASAVDRLSRSEREDILRHAESLKVAWGVRR